MIQVTNAEELKNAIITEKDLSKGNVYVVSNGTMKKVTGVYVTKESHKWLPGTEVKDFDVIIHTD